MAGVSAACSDVFGASATGTVNVTVNSVNVPVGRSVYTPLLTPDGGFRSRFLG